MSTFAVKRKRTKWKRRSSHPSRFSYRGSDVMDQQTKIHSILHSTGAQAKLNIGQSNDKYEREADHVSDQVMSMPDPKFQRQAVNEEEEETVQTKPVAEQITPLMQRQEESPEEEEETTQAKGDGAPSTASSSVEAGINSIRGNGQPLAVSTRTFFEPRFGVNFSDVRVHTDSNASNLSQNLNAKAFTIGKNIVFDSGQYSPYTVSGKRLLSHELTHVVQQNRVQGIQRSSTNCSDMPVKKLPYKFKFSVKYRSWTTNMLPSSTSYIGTIRGSGPTGPEPNKYFWYQFRECKRKRGGQGNALSPVYKVRKDNKYHHINFKNGSSNSHGFYVQILINRNDATKGDGIIHPWPF